MEKSKHVNRHIQAQKSIPMKYSYMEQRAYDSVFYTLPGPELDNLFENLESFGWKVDRVNNRLTHNAKGESLRKDYKLIKRFRDAQMKRELLKKQENLRKSNLEFRVLVIFLICLVIMIVIIIITAL